MSEILKVLNKSVELKSEKVELGLVDDYKKQAAKGFGAYRRTLKEVESLNSQISKVLADSTEAKNMLSGTIQGYQKIENASKELGVDVPKDVKQERDNIASMFNELDAIQKQLRKMN